MLLPGTAMFEACAAAAAVLLDVPLDGRAALHSVGIADALAMPVQGSLVLEAAVSLHDGAVQLRSVAPGRSSRSAASMQHCSGYFGAVRQPAVTAGESISQAAAGGPWPTLCRTITFAAAAAAAPAQPSAVAAIWVPHAAQQNGYCMQPAAADAVLHLSGAFNRTAAPLQIPVAMSALAIQSPGGHSCWVHPAATPAGSDGEQTSLDYSLQDQRELLFQLDGLLVKQVGAAAKPARPAGAAAQQPADYMYSIDWQAEEQLQPAATAVSGSAERKRGWTVGGRSPAITAVFAGSASRTAAQAAAAATDGLELLQQRLPQMGSGSLSLQVQATTSQLASSVGGRAPAAAAAAASLAALVKGAGMEFKAVNLRSSSVDAAVTAAAFADPAVDAFGTAATSGAVLRAKLLRAPMAAVLANSHLMPLPRGSLADLKLVPHAKTAPGPGEIKVRSEAWAAVTCILSFIFLTTRSTAHLSFSAGLRTCGGPELP